MHKSSYIVLLCTLLLALSSLPLSVIAENELADTDQQSKIFVGDQQKKDKYVTGRYFCVSANDSSDSRGTCDVTTHATTCNAAIKAHREDIASRGDVCKHCIDNIVDNTKRYNGKMEWIHGGPCRGLP